MLLEPFKRTLDQLGNPRTLRDLFRFSAATLEEAKERAESELIGYWRDHGTELEKFSGAIWDRKPFVESSSLLQLCLVDCVGFARLRNAVRDNDQAYRQHRPGHANHEPNPEFEEALYWLEGQLQDSEEGNTWMRYPQPGYLVANQAKDALDAVARIFRQNTSDAHDAFRILDHDEYLLWTALEVMPAFPNRAEVLGQLAFWFDHDYTWFHLSAVLRELGLDEIAARFAELGLADLVRQDVPATLLGSGYLLSGAAGLFQDKPDYSSRFATQVAKLTETEADRYRQLAALGLTPPADYEGLQNVDHIVDGALSSELFADQLLDLIFRSIADVPNSVWSVVGVGSETAGFCRGWLTARRRASPNEPSVKADSGDAQSLRERIVPVKIDTKEATFDLQSLVSEIAQAVDHQVELRLQSFAKKNLQRLGDTDTIADIDALCHAWGLGLAWGNLSFRTKQQLIFAWRLRANAAGADVLVPVLAPAFESELRLCLQRAELPIEGKTLGELEVVARKSRDNDLRAISRAIHRYGILTTRNAGVHGNEVRDSDLESLIQFLFAGDSGFGALVRVTSLFRED